MGDDIDWRLWKVVGLCVACVGGLFVVLTQTPGVELAATFGGGPVGIALAAVAVVAGIAGWVALEVSTEEAFAD
jgi:hypothetical protein